MKRLVMVALLLVVSLMFGCGEETKTVYVESSTGAKISITGVNKQQLQFSQNSDGSLQDLDNGSMKLYPSDVNYIAYSSEKVGYYKNSHVKGFMGADGLVKFDGMPNGGSGVFVAIMKDGSHCEVFVNRKVETYKPMYYSVSGYKWYAYGQQQESLASMYMNNMEVNVTFQFGCDQFVGLESYVLYTAGAKLVFIEENGAKHESAVQKDLETGNLLASVSFMLPEAVDAFQYHSVKGKFYIVLPNGFASQLNFNWDVPVKDWYIESYTDNLWQNYDEDSGYVLIRYYAQ